MTCYNPKNGIIKIYKKQKLPKFTEEGIKLKRITRKFIIFICFFALISFAYAKSIEKTNNNRLNRTISPKTKNEKLIKHDDKKIKKESKRFSQKLKDWKKPVVKKSQTVLDNVYLSGDENDLELIIKDGQAYIELEEKLVKIKNEKDIKKFKKDADLIKEENTDSRIDAYIAFLAEKNGDLDYAYEKILDAISKQPKNELYKKLFKRIYEKRVKLITDYRENIMRSND
ncbi:hypothetical protein [Paramaledivibacter caminithermalis]|jgi:hypothetical protein|uniref:Uncharacterized protein n=1 Tax=Paramaledivibacter caminithermalis (strain DSM 15212 / CIP 107654 / DViRD3) TaxID=1121301 RepID=A0A1M6TNS3_PARC5|nr:hypothetical protein [Paramaledivibacter caminithermalis]SHK58692.1 hypothetical protein SAMN02745912_03748 [Paramaledivibacter caminithermalis DSM 15212]